MQELKTEKEGDPYYCLQANLNKTTDKSMSAVTKVKESINIRSKNIDFVQQFMCNHLDQEEKDHWVEDISRICSDYAKYGVAIAVVGPENSYKSEFLTALLNWKIILPTSDEQTTRRIIRIIYSTTSVIKMVRISSKKETVISEEYLVNQHLSTFINIVKNQRKSIEEVTTICEIGLPSEILQNGLKIIDFPAIDSDFQSDDNINLEIMKILRPSVFCYVSKTDSYCYDKKVITKIIQNLCMWDRYYVEFVMVTSSSDANKLGTLDFRDEHCLVNNNFSDAYRRKYFKLVKIARKIEELNVERLLYPIKIDNYFCMKFDYSKLLPSVAFNEKNYQISSDNITEFMNLLSQKVIALSRSILINLADYLAQSNINQETKINLWYNFQSLSVEKDLINSVLIACSIKDNLLLKFSFAFQVYGLCYQNDQIQVTVISKCPEIDFCGERRRIMEERNSKYITNKSSLIYESRDKMRIYLINKHMPHARLIDNLDSIKEKLGQYWIVTIIRSVLDYYINEGNLIFNFRPDNVFINESGSIFISSHVPNQRDLFFLAKNKRPIRPFYLHPDLHSSLSKMKIQSSYNNSASIQSQFLHSLGWFLWMLLDDGGFEGIDHFDFNENNKKSIMSAMIAKTNQSDLTTAIELCLTASLTSCEQDRLFSILGKLSGYVLCANHLRTMEWKENSMWLKFKMDHADKPQWRKVLRNRGNQIYSESSTIIRKSLTTQIKFAIEAARSNNKANLFQVTCMGEEIMSHYIFEYLSPLPVFAIRFIVKFYLKNGHRVYSQIYEFKCSYLSFKHKFIVTHQNITRSQLHKDILPNIDSKINFE